MIRRKIVQWMPWEERCEGYERLEVKIYMQISCSCFETLWGARDPGPMTQFGW